MQAGEAWVKGEWAAQGQRPAGILGQGAARGSEIRVTDRWDGPQAVHPAAQHDDDKTPVKNDKTVPTAPKAETTTTTAPTASTTVAGETTTTVAG